MAKVSVLKTRKEPACLMERCNFMYVILLLLILLLRNINTINTNLTAEHMKKLCFLQCFLIIAPNEVEF